MYVLQSGTVPSSLAQITNLHTLLAKNTSAFQRGISGSVKVDDIARVNDRLLQDNPCATTEPGGADRVASQAFIIVATLHG